MTGYVIVSVISGILFGSLDGVLGEMLMLGMLVGLTLKPTA